MHSFGTSRADGVAPQGSLLRASDGTFYGTTVSGGDDGDGTVFRMTLAGEVTILHTFSRSSLENGRGPSPQLIEASDGNIYGTTGSGGELGDSMAGTAFRLSPSGGLTTLFSFEPPESPHNPVGGLVQGIDGAFYGLTNYSGIGGGGDRIQAGCSVIAF